MQSESLFLKESFAFFKGNTALNEAFYSFSSPHDLCPFAFGEEIVTAFPHDLRIEQGINS